MLPMADLAGFFSEAGCTNVRTYIQSGNVVFAASPTVATRIAMVISKKITDHFGHRVPLVIRRADEMAVVVEHNPFPKADPSHLAVGFLSDLPEETRVSGLDPRRSPGDSFRVLGREIYLHIPAGFADTRLTNAYFDTALATVSTFRNWRTVLKLIEMSRAAR